MKRTLFPALLLLSAAAASAAPCLEPVTLTYLVSWSSMSLGEATVALTRAEAPDCYRYDSVTRPIGLVRFFYGEPHEHSDFCVVNGRVQPRRFEYSNTKNRSDNFTLDFDWATRKVRSSRGDVRDLPDDAMDRFVMQQAVRLWLLSNLDKADPGHVTYTLVDDDRMRPFRFALTQRETVDVPAGKFETLLVERVDNPKRTSRYWVAPSRGYMPVKVEQYKQGKLELRMVLKQ